MKQHIDITQLIKLSPEKLFSLSNNETMEPVLPQKYHSIEEAEDAINGYEENTFAHRTLEAISFACSIPNLIALIDNYGKFNIESLPTEETTTYYVSINHHPEMDKFIFKADELCDALWEAVVQRVLQ
ncbi:hypothetical protein U8V72_17615 [Priestia filamentosa]|uniref:hypothetical protein n=1 Tax=Priestia filamentosa TaxID=1402861 RepID=UPI0005893927